MSRPDFGTPRLREERARWVERASLDTNKDYESLRRELLARAPQLTDRWTDFNASDLGVVLLELFCGVGDMLAYYLDAQAGEAYLPTARQRQNVIQLCRLIGYRLDSPVAATTTLRFSLAEPLEADLVIPARTTARARLDDGDVDFETVAEAILPRGRLSVDVSARQGRRKVETFTGAGEPNAHFSLTGTQIAQGSLGLHIDEQAWREVFHFQESGSEDDHFQVETDGLDRTRILFGDGVRGAAPAADAAIRVEYLETLGAGGNLGTGVVTQLTSPLHQDGEPVAVNVTNPVPATGGADRESVEHARRQAPAEIRTLWKALTKDDYKALAESYPGVAKAQVLDVNDCPNLRYYQVNLAVAPEGGGPPSALLKRDLAAFLESRKVVTLEINLYDALYRPVSIDADIHAYSGEDLDLVRRRIEQALADYFDFERRDFGQAVPSSDLVALLDGVRGVSHAHLYAPAQDVAVRAGTIPVLGEVRLDVRRAA